MKQTRNTLQRDLVLQAVRGMHTHPTADEVYAKIAQSYPSISRATVYRNLGVLAQNGDIQRVTHLNAADRFDYQTHPHYHFRCRKCDSVYDVHMPYEADMLAHVQNPDGFTFESYELTFTGVCSHCKKSHGTAN